MFIFLFVFHLTYLARLLGQDDEALWVSVFDVFHHQSVVSFGVLAFPKINTFLCHLLGCDLNRGIITVVIIRDHVGIIVGVLRCGRIGLTSSDFVNFSDGSLTLPIVDNG